MKICLACLFGNHEEPGHESDCSCPCHGQQAYNKERNEIHLVKRVAATPVEFTSWC
jgi:hypothetical protein